MEKITLLTFFEVLSSKINCWLSAKNKISGLGLQIPDLSHSTKVGLMVFTFLVATNSFAQTSPANCKLGCTSNDVQIKKAYLSDQNGNQLSPTTFVCPGNGQATVYLTLELTTNTPRVGVVIYANIKNFTPPSTVGSLVTNITQCFDIALNQPTNKVTFSQSFTWTCGNPIVLTDVFIGWGTGNSNFCTGAGFQCPGTSSKCYQLPSGQYIPIVTPTANSASLRQCSTTPGGTIAVFDLTSLNSTVIGSQTNVTVLWFTDSSLYNQITTNPSATAYPSASATVYAKVTSTISPYPYSSVAVTLTVNQPPNLVISNPAAVCSPSTINLTSEAVTNGSTLPAGTTLSYWTNATATTSLTSPSAVATAGTYYIKASSNTNPTCTDIKPVTVTINAAPAAPISGGDKTQCEQSPIQTLTATATGGTITWYDAATGGNLVGSPTKNTTGSVTYYAQASNGTCSSLTRT
ncbi:hypothetical protein ACFX5D_16020, partial [Flavobacterium sp. LB3P45]